VISSFSGPAPPKRAIVYAGGVLIVIGLFLSLTASPAAAARMDFDSAFHFAWRHAAFAAIAAVALVGCALAEARPIRRAGAIGLLAALLLLVIVLLIGHENKGAQRWLMLAGMTFQPAELAKPGLVLFAAWMLAEKATKPRFPGIAAAIAAYGATAGLLILQPDFGQTILLGAALAAMLFLAGAPLQLFLAGGVVSGAGLVAAYHVVPHFKARIGAFIHGNYQVDQALEAIQSGGILGRGPGEGVVKNALPDVHADFVYAAAAEEFGWLASLGLVALYGWIIWTGLKHAREVSDPFRRLASSGLFLLFGFQAAIHIAVNMNLMPAKGMTLPLVSYGGSAMIGSALTLGCAAALLRERRPRLRPIEETANTQDQGAPTLWPIGDHA
jgi:cell division protein FtsW